MNWEKLELKHKKQLHSRLKNITPALSEFSFANLFLFRKAHDYEISTEEPVLVRGKTYDGKTYLMPTEDISKIDKERVKELAKDVDFVFPIPEEWLDYLEQCGLTASYKDGDTDYIYTTEKMCTYKGRKLHKKRNLLKNFKLNHEHSSKPLTEENIDDALMLLEVWQANSGLSREETDYQACKEALELHEELVLCGIVYYADEKPAGFVMGEELNEETFVLHFAKGDVQFKGIYQFMYNNFAKKLPVRYKYINFEQDLGKTALRIAKTSYIPDKLLKKYRVVCNP